MVNGVETKLLMEDSNFISCTLSPQFPSPPGSETEEPVGESLESLEAARRLSRRWARLAERGITATPCCSVHCKITCWISMKTTETRVSKS